MRRIIVLTGEGKGKTTSAIGSAVRAAGRGFRIYFYQFLKSKDADYGEHLFFKNYKGIRMVRLGLGCRRDFKYTSEDKKAATDGLKKIVAELSKNKNAKVLCVLDEISYPMNWNWFKTEEVTRLIKKYPKVNFILTGRDMPKSIIKLADTVSSVDETKHAYQKGHKAERGIEF